MSKTWKCPACKEEWVGDKEDLKDLCPMCLGEIREGCTEILLGKGDAAIVLRAEGGQEMFLPEAKDEDADASPVMVALTKVAIGLSNRKVQDIIDEVMIDYVEEFQKRD